MAGDPGRQAGSFWDKLKSKASDMVARPGAALVRGKTAARDVFDDAGNLLVGAGREIDDSVIEKATAVGKMPAIVAAAAAAQGQDLKEKMQGEYARTAEGRERRNLANSDDYIEARRYIRCVAAVEVTDIRGNLLVAAGKIIDDEDVRRARDAGLLAALIYSAQQGGSAPPPPPPDGANAEAARQAAPLPPRRRTAVPLGETFEE